MSGAGAKKGIGSHAVHLLLLAGFSGLMLYVTRLVPETHGSLWTIAAIGFLLLAGTLLSELLAPIGLPHLTGYLVAGIASGPYALRLVDEHTVKSLSPINGLALSLIALAGGAELDLASVRKSARSLTWAMAVQCLLVIVVVTGVFLAVARPMIPFTRGLGPAALFGVAMLWGALAVTRSPSATLGILSQTRASGPLAVFTLSFVMVSDVVVVVLIAMVLGCVRPLIDPSTAFSLESFKTLGHEIVGSVALGTTLGLVLAAYLRLANRQMLVVLLVLGFGVSTVIEYLQFDSLLTFIVAGFIVRNMSNQGHKFTQYIEKTGSVVYVVFFATAGADLDIPLVRELWPVALVLAGSRALVTWGGSAFAGAIAGDPPLLRRWSWSGLISQAGLALGLSVIVAREFPTIGPPFRALAIATVAINEMIGPVLFKLALDRAGETSQAQVATFPSMPPPPMH
ncbi:MAG TPA: cation:proton antiporter [Polyangiaceae bacterium]|jgi:Kef-type K+ transport system membrane component KefB|nr:cation:proton antiporter [Polyangiaceae bacterium]